MMRVFSRPKFGQQIGPVIRRPVMLVFAGALIGLCALVPEPLEAQRLRDNPQPAEIPPASYTGNQYVDSNGCVFIRAGVDGNVTWVPRVARNREVICGFQPTRLSGTSPAPEPRQQVVQITPQAGPEAAAASQASDPAPSPVQRTTVVRTPTRQAQPPGTATTAPRAPVTPVPAPAAALTPKTAPTTTIQSGCTGASAVSQQYVSKAPGARCGPQEQPFVTLRDPAQRQIRTDGTIRRIPARNVKIYAGTSGAADVTARTVIAPRATYQGQAAAVRQIPPGYRPAFDDGRFNPQRAHQTLEGRRQMLLVWTNTVPRELIDQRTGQNVGHLFPGVTYPDMPGQSGKSAAKAQPGAGRDAPALSSRSTPQKIQGTAATHRYVEVGVFRPDGAQVAIQRLQQAGLTVGFIEFTHKGETVRRVLAGPFDRQEDLVSALERSKGLGFSRAKLRK